MAIKIWFEADALRRMLVALEDVGGAEVSLVKDSAIYLLASNLPDDTDSRIVYGTGFSPTDSDTTDRLRKVAGEGALELIIAASELQTLVANPKVDRIFFEVLKSKVRIGRGLKPGRKPIRR